LLDMGLATVLVCATTLAAFIATAVLSEEIENKTVLTVVSKPVGRPLFVIAKYAGVMGAILLAVFVMLLFFFIAIRHGVMSTARDRVDLVVVLFTGLSVIISVGLGIWGNYFYGWVFSSTASFTLAPTLLVAWIATLGISEEWALQPLTTDFKPQILLASLCVAMAMMVLTSVALAASTRLGQVMTIVVCAGVFLAGLLSNHLLGHYAFDNDPVARLTEVTPLEAGITLRKAGEKVKVTFDQPAPRMIHVGDAFYFGPDPSGISLVVPHQRTFEGDPTLSKDVYRTDGVKALVYSEVGRGEHTIVNIGDMPVARLPREGDFVFVRPTRVNWIARTAWSVVPNIQAFWLVDAITQGHGIPPRYIGLMALYSVFHVTAFMSLAVALFQRRDVG
ncbi:MAG: hypothetical protein KDA21_11610, partial [Phycisphaerales bacterium]|nr:hypothetical protein [Phycisphaerales bacterium]